MRRRGVRMDSAASNFNPRTREGCDLKKDEYNIYLVKISIHAPVKGATLWDELDPRIRGNFNPRTREGCDPRSWRSRRGSHRDFNPRTREGCDRLGRIPDEEEDRISIHAPVKGATDADAPVDGLSLFQSTHP